MDSKTVLRLIAHLEDARPSEGGQQRQCRIYECTRCKYKEKVPCACALGSDSGHSVWLICPVCGGPFVPARG